MIDVRRLIHELADRERELAQCRFLAPCVRGGKVCTRIAGLIYTYHPHPRNSEGWGVFRPRDAATACWDSTATLSQIDAYLGLLMPIRLHLAKPLRGRTWLAYPGNEGDARQRLGGCKPVPVHLVGRGAALETVLARWDGTVFWFEDLDRSADPRLAEALRESLQAGIPAGAIRHKGLTPELKTAYALARGEAAGYACRRPPPSARDRLHQALEMAGGRLRDFQDRGDYWLVEWHTRDGERHSSAIAKQDLTVVSAGICLSGQDRHFDLHSLVGVVEQRPGWV